MKLWIKTLLMLGSIILVTGVAVAAYTLTVLNSTTQAFKMTYTNAGSKQTEQVIKATKPLTILVMGIDTGGEGRGTADSWNGNSDSQILITLDPTKKTTTMVSVERDTMTNILDGSGNIVSKEKLNAAYPLGYNAGGKTKGLETGVSYAMKTIGEQTGINIDNFITMNFDGLINLVNDVGGIDIVNDSNGVDVYQNTTKGQKITLPTGETIDSGAIYISDTEPDYSAYIPYYSDNRVQHINGEQALVFARDRHTLANGDYGRMAHQREVISALMKKLLALDNITQYQKLLTDASKDFKTNIPVNASTITSLLGYKDCFNKIVSIQYEGVGNMVDGVSYQFTPTNVYLAMQNAMKKSLEQSTVTSLPESLITYESTFGSYSSPQYYMPSATITENGKSTVYGIDTEGNFITINSSNSGQYVSTGGGSVQSDSSSSSSGTSSSSSTASSSSLDSTTSDTNSGSGTSSNDSSSYGNNTGTYTGQ